jgi:N-acylglucosamine 2-epimerase/mannose-6-phosphate isomerase
MFDVALPVWADKAVDPIYGGAVESFRLDGVSASAVDFKRARVSSRQIYVFSHAEMLGWRQAEPVSDQLFEYFLSRFWLGSDLGWARRVSKAGLVIDSTPDLYDYAFALFALGWRYKARKDPVALKLAHQTLDVLEKKFAHPSGEGYFSFFPPSLPREQNPHMHLLEAALTLFEASGEQRFESMAKQLSALFATRLFRKPDGVLIEYFDDEWRPMDGDLGRRVEPGHMFEWAWILAQDQRLSGADHKSRVQLLVEWAERFGVDPISHATYNAVRCDGVPLDRGSRTWPNTERLKAWVAHATLNNVNPWPAIEGAGQLLLERYLDPAPKGFWIDAFNEHGAPVVHELPSSTFYHLFLAFSEVVRFAHTNVSGEWRRA